MWAEPKQARSATMALVYITIGARTDVWTVIYYIWLQRTGHAPMPDLGEHVLGGHAVCAVGYDITRRWFICRNSWGTDWGMRGYFTIPFAYLTDTDLCADFWTIRVVQ